MGHVSVFCMYFYKKKSNFELLRMEEYFSCRVRFAYGLCISVFLIYVSVNFFSRIKLNVRNKSLVSRDLTIPHLDISHFALCIMGN